MRAAAAAFLLLLPTAALVQAPAPAEPRLLDRPAQGALVRGVAPAGTLSLSLDGRPVPVAPDGRFLLGFDRDAGPAATLNARLANGRTLRLPLNVARRSWPIQRINMARPTGGPTPEYARLREAELARIAAARARGSDSRGWAQAFIWPCRGRFSGRFGSQRIYRGVAAAFHSGTDIAAGAGAQVVAPADGVVVLAPPPGFSLEGNLVILDHGMGLSSAFLHLSSASVRPGDRVRQGQPIGRVGMTGRATGPHLHWSVVWNGVKVDPMTVVRQ